MSDAALKDALAALGIEPALFHFNEGHPALGLFELVGAAMAAGATPEAAWASAKARTVFTTHTPVAAGNEMYSRDQILAVLGRIGDLIGDRERFLAVGRIHPTDPEAPSGMTPLAIRSTRSTNAVSRVHGEVARRMWQPMFPGRDVAGVPITHVTNGVHIPTWLDAPMRDLFDRRLGAGWSGRADDETVWAAIDDISDQELWAARMESRRGLLDLVRSRVVGDRLRRGEELSYSEAGAAGFDLDRVTLGFARRLATYKRLYLVAREPERALRLLAGDHGVQFVFAGKAHPSDDDAKRIVQGVFELKRAPDVAGRVAFLEDYDIPLAARLVAGCDVWINLPRPPLEASGTSGMKAAMNGSLNLSVLDGWWAEAYDGTNGWAIDATPGDEREQDSRDATRLFDLIEHEVVPMFHERDEHGLPHRWLAMVRSSLKTNGPRFSATRMVREYDTKIYRRRR
jgi:starch phosphorylase